MPTEDYAIVLDYLPEGRVDSSTPGYKREKRVAQIIGEEFYSLLEVIIREDMSVSIGESVYIGKDVRDKIHHIVRRLNYNELTSNAKSELKYTLNKLVKEQEQKFVYFFNECTSLTTRQHRLELLPGVGKKHMWDILKTRSAKKFTSFKDISERVKLLPDPEKIIVKRILWELKGEDDKLKQIKYHLFVGVPFGPEKQAGSSQPATGSQEPEAEGKDATQQPQSAPE